MVKLNSLTVYVQRVQCSLSYLFQVSELGKTTPYNFVFTVIYIEQATFHLVYQARHSLSPSRKVTEGLADVIRDADQSDLTGPF